MNRRIKLTLAIILSLILVIICVPAASSAETEHIHRPVPYPSSEPTCLYPGIVGGSFCADCGEVLEERHIIPALGHDERVVEGVKPTHTHTGLTDGVKCARCGEWIVPQQIIPMIEAELKIGDVNADGVLGILDATCIMRWLVDLAIDEPELVPLCGDADGDGAVNIVDATHIQRYLAGYRCDGAIGVPVKVE